MSASPSGLSNNNQTPTPNGTNGGPPGFVRQSKAADPLRPRKKPVRRSNLPKGAPLSQLKGLAAPARGQYPVNGLAAGPIGSRPAPPPVNGAYNGWTNPPESEPRYFPLFTTKRALREGLRYHVMRFSTKKDIDPTNQESKNQEQFIRPITLHRRDPKQPSRGEAGKEEEVPDVVMDSKEREKMEIAKAEKDAKRAADLAQIAPSGNNAAAQAKKHHPFRMEKTTQVYRLDKTEDEKKASDLRYEEALPWHLEDAEGKQTWVGNYEAALSDTNVMFVIEGNRFLMVPIEKWYKFTAKNKFTSFTIEEAETKMNKKIKEPRWVMKAKEEAAKAEPPMHRIYTVKSESNTAKSANRAEMQDMDDLDFAENDLFQDDDEQATVEPDNDEESKETQAKIKREQQTANIFDQANEAEVERELEKELLEIEAERKVGKQTRKALTRREKNLIYESDSDHPYSDSVSLVSWFIYKLELICAERG
jgi:transcription initiation factor TFIIF subunit alpha